MFFVDFGVPLSDFSVASRLTILSGPGQRD
jgi:hypothetical protein